ncbi:MAG: MotA/TolQ/ExbB proton channel family protein [Bryobacteraceae bacterium]
MTPEIWIAQVSFWELAATKEPIPLAVMGFLIAFSLFSWTIIFSKWTMFRRCTEANRQFLRAFRKADSLASVAPIAQQHADAPLSAVFDFGYAEVSRQVHGRGRITNAVAVERTLQLGVGEEITQLERNMNWLATTATVTPFIGLFGTVWGIIGAFQALGLTGSTSMRTVAPGIANALIATALGLGAAIPAAVFYNHFGHIIKEMTARMEDFSLEFLNLTERTFEG